MSTMIISIKSLANVRASLAKSFVWREDSDMTPLCLFEAFMPKTSRFMVKREQVSKAAGDFVAAAMIFNLEEYECGKFAKMNAEPVDYGYYFKTLKRTKGEPLGKVQLLKTLEFISYNTLVKGWLTGDEFNQWSRRDEYKKFHKTIDRLIHALLHDLVSKTEEYKAAVWG